ncbi:ABC transporter ATP-binding protein [Paenisporosarcina sp. TG-14]|uniref:ABC transporter ATP-binding protein n=1 Tax=Paenisporosarcina sp. TG-14 TaxID=1231057 RepID=UPI00031EC57E|nr:ABC transporter ATP-binding protein [Paenisporosarcina sp. TG-14]
MMELRNISKKFEGKIVLERVNLSLKQGEVITILGKSGSGKSTLLQLIAAMEPIDSGEIQKKPETMCAYITQKSYLFSHMTVLQNIAFPLKCQGVRKKERYSIAKNWLEKVELFGLEDRFPYELSGGQQQRVSIARAFVYQPDVFLMDEPFANLDVKLSRQLQHLIFNEMKQRNVAGIFVTHNYEETKMYADHTFLLQDGKLTTMSEQEVELYFNEGIQNEGRTYLISNCVLTNNTSDQSIPVLLDKQVHLYGVDFYVVILPNGQKQFMKKSHEINTKEPLHLVLKEG